MSHIHSPGPPPSHSQMPAQSVPVTSASRQKSKPYATGIAAGVEDEKYQAKYKELKRKVKEIEMDNDKLHYKVLMAKKSIQRMKLERAVLYERLSAVPPSPDLHSHALPPAHSGRGVPPQYPRDIGATHHQHRDHRDFQPGGLNDHNAIEYMHNHSNYRVISGPDGRPVQVPDGPIGPGVAPSHTLSAVHMSRGSSASGHDSSRQLPPLAQLTPLQHLEPPRTHGHSQAHSPHLHAHSNGSSRSRSSPSRSRGHQIYSQVPTSGYQSGGIPHPQQQYPPDPMISTQHGHHSPPHPNDRERSRRHETFDRGGQHGDPYPQSRHHSSSHSSSMVSPTIVRAPSRLHSHHQHVGANMNPDPEYERELERERPWARQEAERELTREYAPSAPMHASPPLHMRSRPSVDNYQYPREPTGPGVHSRSSRSDTSGSGSGSGPGNGGGDGLLRPESHTQYYDRERGPYAPRHTNSARGPSEDQDVNHEEGRSYDRSGGHYLAPEPHRPVVESSRKRSRKDMEIEGNDDVDDSPAAASSVGGGESSRYMGSNLSDDRGSKRIHQEVTAHSHEREQDEDGASDT